MLQAQHAAVQPSFMSKAALDTGDAGNGFARVFCDTFLFMLMLEGFCEAGHVAPPPRHAYSIRLRLRAWRETRLTTL
jgi:hypothetical protein